MYRRGDPGTSREAAVQVNASTDRAALLRILLETNKDWLTNEAMDALFQKRMGHLYPGGTVPDGVARKRRSECALRGWVEENPREEEMGHRGRWMRLHRITPLGRAVVEGHSWDDIMKAKRTGAPFKLGARRYKPMEEDT